LYHEPGKNEGFPLWIYSIFIESGNKVMLFSQIQCVGEGEMSHNRNHMPNQSKKENNTENHFN